MLDEIELSLWDKVAKGDTKARNQIWEKYQKNVEYIARKIHSGLPKHVDFEDLKSAGQIGLHDAIMKYDPARGFKFSTYAVNRIRGSIIDDLRAQDWIPRSVRHRDRTVEQGIQQLTQELGRDPEPSEIAEYLGMELPDVQKAIDSLNGSAILNIDLPLSEDPDFTLGDAIASTTGDPESAMSVLDVDKLVEAIGHLPEREKVTFALHYGIGLTLAEIGKMYDVTESRVCQIHTKALRTVRSEFLSS